MFGANSILPKEHGGKFFSLPLIAFLEVRGRVCEWVGGHSGDPGRELFIGAAARLQIPFFWKKKYVFVYFLIYLFRSSVQDEVGAVCTWDSSVHDSLCLNRVTPGKCNTKKTNRDSQRTRKWNIFVSGGGFVLSPWFPFCTWSRWRPSSDALSLFFSSVLPVRRLYCVHRQTYKWPLEASLHRERKLRKEV